MLPNHACLHMKRNTMRLKILLLFMSCCFLFDTAVSADTGAQVVFEKTSSQLEASIKNEIKKSHFVEDFADFINEQFKLNQPLYLVIGEQDGPLYDPESNKILIPYLFIEEIKSRFQNAKYAESGVSVNDATLDALMHTLFHELAHALIWTYELPVLGKEEDAADNLATVLLIEYFEDGAEIAISAADLFDLESADRAVLEDEDFWDEHSLDDQRFYSTMCLVYGSDPDTYSNLKTELGFTEQRAELCIVEYESVSRSWFDVLEPHMHQN